MKDGIDFGMQIIIEGLALTAFQMLKAITKDPLLKQLLHYVVEMKQDM